jgi:hypothetical protein
MEGRACSHCGCVKFPLLCVYYWRPPRTQYGHTYPEFYSARARCIDRRTCEARVTKRTERAKVRGSKIVLAEPPGDPEQRARSGFCSWCGKPMWRKNKDGQTVMDLTRSYHNEVKGDGECRELFYASYTYRADGAVAGRARLEGKIELECVDCGKVCETIQPNHPDARCRCGHKRSEHVQGGAGYKQVCNVEGCTGCRSGEGESIYQSGFRAMGAPWEADHEIELEDGGEHSVENLRCRCVPCHKRKTAASIAARRPPKPKPVELTEAMFE